MTPNPLAKHRKVADALLQLREQRGYSHLTLADLSGVSQSVISRIEHPYADLNRRPDPEIVSKLLAGLGVPDDSDGYKAVLADVAIAGARGWWTHRRYAQMGAGQRDAAIVELGADQILEYGGLLLPGLAQTADYARARSTAADIDAIVAGRIERQRRVADAEYRLVLEEQAIRRRPGVTTAVMRDQLRHLLKMMERPHVGIRVLPVDAELDAWVPRHPYMHVSYGPGDPEIVTLDQVTQVGLVTIPTEVTAYAQLHQQLWNAAMSDADTAALIAKVADSLASR